MAITLGTIEFDEAYTEVKEKLEEVGGRNERKVTVSGLVLGEASTADIHARLDAILDEASAEDYSVALSIRSGRRMYVRRNEFRRDVRADALTGSFVLELMAKEPLEEAIAPIIETWNVAGDGDLQVFVPGGTVETLPTLSFSPSADVVNPGFGDGARTLRYSGVVSAGEAFVVDGNTGRVTLEGVDVLAYTTGMFPRLDPGGTGLIYYDDLVSPVAIVVTVTHASRWW